MAAGAPLPGAEAEPNDRPAQANSWSLDVPATGQLNGVDDSDAYRFTVDPTNSGARFDLRLRSDSRAQRRVCLRLPDGTDLQCRAGLGEVTLADLSPAPGDYVVAVSGDADPSEHYTLAWIITGRAAPARENEPNDTHLTASPLDAQNRTQGRFTGDDKDIYRLTVTGKPQLWRIQVTGDGINTVNLLDAVGDSEHHIGAQTQRRVRLTDLLLLPGIHYIAVAGGPGGEYRVAAIPLGPPPEGVEQEPNDAPDQANPLVFKAPRTGLLNETGDIDAYRFTLATQEHIRLTVTPPEDGRLQARVWWGDGFAIAQHDDPAAGSPPWTLDTFLQPGDYVVRLSAIESGDSPYTVNLVRGDPFAALTDLEPNDGADLASPLPATLAVTGTVGKGDNYDWYRLPPLPADTGVKITAPPAVTLDFYDAKAQSLADRFQRDSGSGVYTGSLPASGAQPYTFRVGGDSAYEIKLAFDKGPAAVPASSLPPLKLTFSLQDNQVAAFWPVGQAVSGTLSLENTGTRPLTVSLDLHSSNKIAAQTAQSQVTIPASGRQDVPVPLLIAADLPVDRFPVTWRGRAADGGQVTVGAEVVAEADSPPQAPRRVWPMPDSMLGGLNVALLSLGAQIVTPDADLAQRQQVLHDGYTTLGDVFQTSADRLPISLTVKLTGDIAVPVTGILLNPQSPGPVYEKLQDFELWLSQDGQDFARALTGTLSSHLVEQAFPLPQPMNARYAQLRLLSNHVGNRGYVALGEWKVVASPGAAPGTAVGGPVNLADPAKGGEIVTFEPQQNLPDYVASMLQQDKRATRISVPAGTSAEWVIGFQHGRAAQVASLQWIDGPDVIPAERFTGVDVSASLDSPAGPWTPLGHWKLSQGQSTLTLPVPTWVRYLRMISAVAAKNASLAMPDVLRMIERPIDPDYRSAIGEWGHYSRDGVYEWLNPPPAAVTTTNAAANDSVEKSQAITPGTPVLGTVQIGQTAAWYRIDVPAGQNAVVLRMTGQPTVNVRAVFQDAAGKPLPVTSEPISPAEQVITATVAGGASTYFRIEEPPRSVIFAWDQSGSLGAYQHTIYSALMSYIAGVTPGREVVNLLPFGGSLLLKTWGEDPTVLQQALNNYDRSDASSNAEETLLKATEELAYRDGTKAVVFVTDAESNGYDQTAKLWDALAAVKPRVFTLGVTSHVSVGDAPANPQQLMQNYAAVNGGYYDYLRTTGDLDVVFARAAAWLRRPADYAFTAKTAALPPPGPGKLSVLSSLTGQDASASAALLGNTAVEIIFDASGSMTQPLGKSTRIGVAHDVLNNLIDNILPQGIPLALRAFGNREGNYSCRTDLEIPLAPLDPAKVKATVNALQPQKLGATPIAAALLKVPEDLKDAGPGPKLIVLVTDGEESCKGDPAAAIVSLRQQGFDVRLNVVGFTVTDKKLKDQMASWAKAGGGQFFAAADQKALSGALNQAIRVPYRVLDDQGQVVAQGTVDGDPIRLPAGVYRVEVMTNPVKILEGVTVTSGKDRVVRVKGGE